MPTYEFECQSCGNRHSLIMKMSEISDYPKVCSEKRRNEDSLRNQGDGASFPEAGFMPNCGGELTQVYDSAVNFAVHFKGQGWTPKFGPVNRG